MNIEQCKSEIKRHEGEVLEVYEDSLGYKTLGVGHLCQPQDPEYNCSIGTPVSQEVVDMYFEYDFDKHLQETIHVFGSEEELVGSIIGKKWLDRCKTVGGFIK
jgi:GH24 family phage-related lysozyme (muramidase)